ncbi:hypothetical protein COB28_04195 [Candidatus Dependentiae bacterium]|nr:MAG: hypothetical protein COB28_04195 [Candidatus Dependentiae bacterium]
MKKLFCIRLLFLFCMPIFLSACMSDEMRGQLFVASESYECPSDHIFLKEVARHAFFTHHADLYRGATQGHWFIEKNIGNLQKCRDLTPPGFIFNEENAERLLTSEEILDISMYIFDQRSEELKKQSLVLSEGWLQFVLFVRTVYYCCQSSVKHE